MYKAKKGGRKSNRKGKAKGGRPPKHSKIWTQTLIESLGKDTPLDTMPQISIQYLNKQNNPHIVLCICLKCKNIARRPVRLNACDHDACDHAFCFNCIVLHIKGKDECESQCPECNSIIPLHSIKPCKHIESMIKVFQIECCYGCGQTYNINNHSELKKNMKNHVSIHTTTNSSSNLTVSDIFNLTEQSDISRNVEDVALHIIKTKMSQSANKTIEFKSGGPRVSKYYIH